MWLVTVWARKAGKRFKFTRQFDDEPSAHRFALHIVEAGPGTFSTVERVD